MSATTTFTTVSRPVARPGFALGRITITELKLTVREPSRMIRLLIPFVLLVIFGSIPFYTQDRASLGGYSLFDAYLPILIAYALGMTALTGLSTVLAGYREKGVLRRLRTTPVGPVRVLAGQLIAQLAMVAVMTSSSPRCWPPPRCWPSACWWPRSRAPARPLRGSGCCCSSR